MTYTVNANAIPVVIWMMLGILLDDGIKSRIMSEIEPMFHDNSLSFDINRICAVPLFNSIYCEALRVRVAAPVGRASLTPSLKFEKWQMKQAIRKPDGKDTSDKPRKHTVKDDQNARVVTEGMQGHWYLYGGGTKMYPGRFFAKQELMAGVSVVLRAFEIELLDHGAASRVQPNMAYFPFGTIPPKGKIGVRIERLSYRSEGYLPSFRDNYHTVCMV